MIESVMEYEVEFSKISPEGKGIAVIDGKNVYVEGVLPGEKAKIEVLSNSKHYLEGRIIERLAESEHRIQPVEDHYHACSPLQIADYDYQVEIKKEILANCFKEFAKETVEVQKFYPSPEVFGYRNKLEFQFTEHEDRIYLAFNVRESRTEKYRLLEGCKLGTEKMNLAALEIVRLINDKQIPAEILKKLVIRESKSTGKVLATLLINIEKMDFTLQLSELNETVDGIVIGFSSPRIPVASVGKILFQEGETDLEESILGKKFIYPYEGFFQNNVKAFEKAVEEIIKKTPTCEKIIELYSGVGAIGLHLTEKAKNILAFESSNISTKYANRNVHKNNIKNYQTNARLAEDIPVEVLEDTDVLVVDPPRSGLHKRLLDKINETKPKTILYLSCNPVTLANDYRILKDLYTPESLIGFDFYPNTPHLEGLLVLNLK